MVKGMWKKCERNVKGMWKKCEMNVKETWKECERNVLNVAAMLSNAMWLICMDIDCVLASELTDDIENWHFR